MSGSNDALEYQRKMTRLLDCGQDGVCSVRAPGCRRHCLERNRELADALQETCEELDKALFEAKHAARLQREACAKYLEHWAYDKHALSRVRATPLVTDGE